MKRIALILIYNLCVSFICAQTNYYLEDKTFNEDGYIYQCDVDENTRWVTLYNKDNQYTYVDHYDRYTGKQISIEENQNGGEQLESDDWTRLKCISIINTSFSEEEKERIKNRAITILLYVNSDTGRISEVEFQFPNFNPFATIPISVYRQIEVELKNNVWFTPTEEGKRRNYILRAWMHEVR